jgi:dynein heavy chain
MLYMTTTLPRPHYTPEVCIMIKIVNYTATPEGLTDQMINTTVETVDLKIYKANMG